MLVRQTITNFIVIINKWIGLTFRVDIVSLEQSVEGETQAIRIIKEFWYNESLSILVNLDYQYGIWGAAVDVALFVWLL